jgi:hypothetical protein
VKSGELSWPAGQARQEDELIALYLPTSQLTHAVAVVAPAFELNLPASQAVQADIDPETELNLPGEQSSQLFPALLTPLPTEQLGHAVDEVQKFALFASLAADATMLPPESFKFHEFPFVHELPPVPWP